MQTFSWASLVISAQCTLYYPKHLKTGGLFFNGPLVASYSALELYFVMFCSWVSLPCQVTLLLSMANWEKDTFKVT